MIHVSSPGRVMISGEWSILEEGNPCVVAAIDKRFHAEVSENDKIRIIIDDFKIDVFASFSENHLELEGNVAEDQMEHLELIADAIETTLNYLVLRGIAPKNFSIRLWSDSSVTEEDRIVFGFYSSYTVSVIGAILKFNGVEIENDETRNLIYKLSVVAHSKKRMRTGSAYKIASSLYGGLILYRRFDREWMSLELEEYFRGGQDLISLVNKSWPGLFVKRIRPPHSIIIIAGFAGKPHSSYSKVGEMMNYKHYKKGEFEKIISQIRTVSEALAVNMENDNKEQIVNLIKRNRELLLELEQKSGVEIETTDMRRLSWVAERHGGAGKISGAGRGNCGIAVCFDQDVADKIKKEWKSSGINPVDIRIDHQGLRIEDNS